MTNPELNEPNIYRHGDTDFNEPSLEKEISSEQDEELLGTTEIESTRPISEKGINETLYVSFVGGGAGIFKPKSGEKQVPKMEDIFPAGTYCKRERAAYLVNKAFGFGIVPPTEIRTINGQEGSIQKFIENATPLNLIPQEQRQGAEFQNELIKAWVFDYIINQSDSADENFLVKDGKLSGIDNGLSFEKTQTEFDYDNFWKQPMPNEVKESIENFFGDRENIKSLKNQLSGLLSPDEIKACLSRAEKVRQFVEKNTVWQKAESEVESILNLEQGAKNIVTALNVLEIPTSQSCEGHLDIEEDTRIIRPFVEISVPNQPEKRFVGQDKLIPKVAKKYGMKEEDVRTMLLHSAPWEEFQNAKETEKYKTWRKENKKIAKRGEKILKEFYQDTAVPETDRLSINEQNSGQFEITNVGRGQEDRLPTNEQNLTPEQRAALEQQLSRYQNQMDNFAEFLKEKYFTR